MASILAEARAKTLTENLFNQVLDDLANGENADSNAKDWWKKHKIELIGLGIAEVIAAFAAAQKKQDLSKKYDDLIASMTWKEKIQFLELSVSQMKRVNNSKIKMAALIHGLIQATPKIVAAIIMVI